jgi:hypothetical protein
MLEGTKIFEMIMLLCFGCAWPLSIAKSLKARTNKGKSLFFLLILLLGYISGITNKIINKIDYVMVFYIVNFLMVATDTVIYFRNAKLDKKK